MYTNIDTDMDTHMDTDIDTDINMPSCIPTVRLTLILTLVKAVMLIKILCLTFLLNLPPVPGMKSSLVYIDDMSVLP